MTKIPPMPGNLLVKKIQKFGFVFQRQKGSHVVLHHPDGRIAVVPCHKGHDLDPCLVRKILKEVKIEPDSIL